MQFTPFPPFRAAKNIFRLFQKSPHPNNANNSITPPPSFLRANATHPDNRIHLYDFLGE